MRPIIYKITDWIQFRVLNSLEHFVLTANHDGDPNSNSTVTKYAYQSYGVALVDVSATEFQDKVFRARQIQLEDRLTNSTRSSMMVDFGPENDNSTMDNSIATIHLPQQLLNDCTAAVDTQRLAIITFLSDVLFSSVNKSGGEIRSAVIAAKINCTFEKISTPITIVFNVINQVCFLDHFAKSLEFRKLWCKHSIINSYPKGIYRVSYYFLTYKIY